jgi:hypothetical protein
MFVARQKIEFPHRSVSKILFDIGKARYRFALRKRRTF